MSKLELLKRKSKKFREALACCKICPHECGVDRTTGGKGFCRTGNKPVISSFGPHFGEERELVGPGGSGTIFFTACNLACKFCQNFDISQQDDGKDISVEKLAEIMLSLEARGCANINFVTPTHQLPMILDALVIAVGKGLELPLVYNCGGYEKVETIRELEGIIDIYMPDFKWGNNALGKKYSGISDYFDRISESILEMHRQVGSLATDSRGVAERGLLIRHLVMPNIEKNREQVLSFIAEKLPADTYINIMDQYHPAYKANGLPDIDRRLTMKEYLHAVEYAKKLGFHRGF